MCFYFHRNFQKEIKMSQETKTTVRCVLCQGGLCLNSGNLHNFKDHLEKAHNAVFDLDFLVSIAFLETAEREKIVETVYPRVKKYFQTLRSDPLSGQLNIEKRLLEDLEESSCQVNKRRKVKGSKYVSLTEQEEQKVQEEEQLEVEVEEVEVEEEIEEEGRKYVAEPQLQETNRTEVEKIPDKSGEEMEMFEEEKSHQSRCDICEKPMLKKSIRKHKQRVHQLFDNPRNINESLTEDDSITDSSLLEPQVDLEIVEKSKPVGGSITCQLCFKLMSKKNYRRHMSSVHNDEEHKCKICFARFPELDSLKDHVKDLHDIDYDNLENCEAQDEVQLDDSTVESIGETEGTGKDYQCDQCEMSYHVKDSLRRHKRKKH